MKLPLLLHANPRILAGATVMLEKGNWMIESNHRDSIIRIALNSNLLPLNPSINLELNLDSDSYVSANINTKGTEKEITIYAVRI